MNTIEEALAGIFLKLTVAIPGLIGAIFSLRFYTQCTRIERILAVFGGWSCAAFTSDPVLSYFKLSEESWRYGTTFFIGLFGMALVSALVVFINGITGGLKSVEWADIITGWIKK